MQIKCHKIPVTVLRLRSLISTFEYLKGGVDFGHHPNAGSSTLMHPSSPPLLKHAIT